MTLYQAAGDSLSNETQIIKIGQEIKKLQQFQEVCLAYFMSDGPRVNKIAPLHSIHNCTSPTLLIPSVRVAIT